MRSDISSLAQWKAGARRYVTAGLAMAACGAAASTCTLDGDGLGVFSNTTSSAGGGATSSGMGGEGGLGGGGQGGGAQALEQWTAAPPDSSGAYELPSWLVLDSPSIDKTVQTGPDTVRTGFAKDVARARRVNGDWGLNVESARTNRLFPARIAEPLWAIYPAGSGTIAPTMGPDGTGAGALVTDTSGTVQVQAYAYFAPQVGAEATVSAWAADVSTSNQGSVESNGFPVAESTVVVPAQTGWRRYSVTATEQSFQPTDRVRPAWGGNALTGAARFDFVSHETGRYPSSVIVTVSGPATRDAEKLWVTDPSKLMPDNRFHIVLKIAPNYASTEQGVDHDLLWVDASNRVFINALTHSIEMVMGGQSLTTPALSWDREQVLTIEARNTSGGLSLAASGANEGDVADSSTTPASFPAPSVLRILGNDNGSQECADLQAIAFYPPR